MLARFLKCLTVLASLAMTVVCTVLAMIPLGGLAFEWFFPMPENRILQGVYALMELGSLLLVTGICIFGAMAFMTLTGLCIRWVRGCAPPTFMEVFDFITDLSSEALVQ